MRPKMKQVLKFLPWIGFSLFAACGDSDPVSPPLQPEDPEGYVEPVPEEFRCTNANLVYVGDDIQSGESDSWLLTLYTDMEVDASGNPVGPGTLIRISLNVDCNLEQLPDTSLLAATYREQRSSGDFMPGTFNIGFMTTIDLPTGPIEWPDGSFFGQPAAGQTSFEADLLREGICRIEHLDGQTFSVTGTLVGTKFLKRYFSYEGELKPVNRAEQIIPNTTLTQDITLEGLTQSRLWDRGDAYMLGDESYRRFELLLAEPGVDHSQSWPSGNGQVLRIDFFVAWQDDPAQGIPEGTYTLTELAGGSGVAREDIVPFHIIPGTPDKFTYNTGTWYERLTDGVMTEYARIEGGTMQVSRPDGGHVLAIDFADCGSPAHRVRCRWTSDAPIPLYD